MSTLFHYSIKTFGLDIGEKMLRLVVLKKNVNRFTLKTFNSLPLPPKALRKGKISNEKIFQDALLELLESTPGKLPLKNVSVSIPENQTFTKIATLEHSRADYSYTEQEILENIEQHIPFAQQDMIIDWQWVKDAKDENKKIAFVAVPKDSLMPYLKILESAHLRVVSVETEAQALTRSLISPAQYKKINLIVDIGSTQTLFVIQENGIVTFTRQTENYSGETMTQAIQRELGITNTEAEKIKLFYGLGYSDNDAKRELLMKEIEKILFDELQKLAVLITETAEYYMTHISEKKDTVQNIIISGGAANTKGIQEQLMNMLKIPIEIANPWTYVKKPSQTKFPPQLAQSFNTAIGLGLSSYIS